MKDLFLPLITLQEGITSELNHFRQAIREVENLENRSKLYQLQEQFMQLSQLLEKHIRFDENVLYPFFIRQVPKVESFIYCFNTDHGELEKCFKKIHGLLVEQKKRGDWKLVPLLNEIQELTSLLSYILPHHFTLEQHYFYQVIANLLKQEEKLLLRNKIIEFDTNHVLQ